MTPRSILGVLVVGGLSLWLGTRYLTNASASPASNAKGELEKEAPEGNDEEGLAIKAVVFRGGLQNGWEDWGWAPREIKNGEPAKVNMSQYGGWILGRHRQAPSFKTFRFRMQAPLSHGAFLEVRLRDQQESQFPVVIVQPRHRRAVGEGWDEVTIARKELNPDGLSFNHFSFRARSPVGKDWVLFDEVVLLGAEGEATTEAKIGALTVPSRTVSMSIDCSAPGQAINPGIYGIAYSPRTATRDTHVWSLRPGGRRWGGNPTSRFNWRLGNAWNTSSDWYFMNVNYTGNASFHWRDFLQENVRRKVPTVLTVPIIGWVAKDTSSYSYPVSVFGPQASVEPGNPDRGNGMTTRDEKIAAGDPTRTSVVMSPADIGEWVREIRELDKREGARHVSMYVLDNEPELWNSTHRDVHPDPVGYDELLRRTIEYGTAIRKADPQAVIAGPAAWGWPAYFYSAKDQAAGFREKPDRRAHGDVPLLAWYLRNLRAHEKRTGVRILDVLDVHFYPQARGVFTNGGGGVDTATAALRIRSTRALWDPDYLDESWIRDNIRLLPRLAELIDENYPGLEIMIGEYAFDAEKHISGALALAEALGRFGQAEKMAGAYYWTYPSADSHAFHAFRAFRDYDGAGARFLDQSIPTTAGEGVSLFASRDGSGKMVLIALNLTTQSAVDASIDMGSCGNPLIRRIYRLTEQNGHIEALPSSVATTEAGRLSVSLPPYSLTVLELR
ncbi:MAG: hypothetical protein A2289_11100 [Deltaproteobacteria bacterium RIFOXYA12_FULL_58_15]|nr:MAG: hypothetical protein A2289_11100 [Deltaproteobacteria bacterium RIFOXYA12_FULL_58_15]